METYLSGDTIVLVGEFKDLDGEPIEVFKPTVSIYDNRYRRINEFSLSGIHTKETGKYEFHYTTSEKAGIYIYEFKGEVENYVTLNRKAFELVFIKEDINKRWLNAYNNWSITNVLSL